MQVCTVLWVLYVLINQTKWYTSSICKRNIIASTKVYSSASKEIKRTLNKSHFLKWTPTKVSVAVLHACTKNSARWIKCVFSKLTKTTMLNNTSYIHKDHISQSFRYPITPLEYFNHSCWKHFDEGQYQMCQRRHLHSVEKGKQVPEKSTYNAVSVM